jgi:hypothetical protein
MVRRSEIENAIRRIAPRIPAYELSAIADHAIDSPGLRTASAEAAAWLSMVAFVRHALTDYDSLLEEGYEQESARHFVAEDMRAIFEEWGVKRQLFSED